MNADEYQGRPNRETFHQALIIDNDQGLYSFTRDLARVISDPHKLAEALKEWWEDGVTDVDNYEDEEARYVATILPMVREIGSAWRVDWLDIAKSYIVEVNQ